MAQLGGGDALNAALGGLASQLASGKVNEFSKSMAENLVGDALTESNPGLRDVVANLIGNMISTGIGGAAGGESGANAGSTIDRNDHQNDLGKSEFSDISNVFSNILHLINKDPELFTNSDLFVFKQFFDKNPHFLDGTKSEEVNILINGILGMYEKRNGAMSTGLGDDAQYIFNNGSYELGSTTSLWTIAIPFSSYADAKRIGSLAAMIMASEDASKINLLLHSQGSRDGLEALLAFGEMMKDSDAPREINVVFGAPIASNGNVMDAAIAKLREEHPNWTINPVVAMSPDDGIGPFRQGNHYDNLPNLPSHPSSITGESKHGTIHQTGIDGRTGEIKYQDQLDWIKNHFKQ